MCKRCKSEDNLERHRIIPGLKYGGQYISENLILLCKTCHSQLHKRMRKHPEWAINDIHVFTYSFLRELENGS